MATRYLDIDDYIGTFPPDVQEVLAAARAAVHAAVQGAGETITYQMPTFTLDDKPFLCLAGWKRHLGVYPVPVLDADLEAEVAPYRATKDTVHFTYRQGVPYGLLGRIATAIAENRRRQAAATG